MPGRGRTSAAGSKVAGEECTRANAPILPSRRMWASSTLSLVSAGRAAIERITDRVLRTRCCNSARRSFRSPATPLRRGFGTELLEWLLPDQLSARTAQNFGADGLRCTIELPLPA